VEGDFFSVDPFALAQGQRIRLKRSIVIADEAYGETYGKTETIRIEDLPVAPITRMVLLALHTYGAYVVDNAGGFIFYAEDAHTANLHLSDAQVNALLGQPLDAPFPGGLTKWQLVMERLNEDLSLIPVAAGGSSPWWAYGETGQNPADATTGVSNFEVIVPAVEP
jgi:hypothetical protein